MKKKATQINEWLFCGYPFGFLNLGGSFPNLIVACYPNFQHKANVLPNFFYILAYI